MPGFFEILKRFSNLSCLDASNGSLYCRYFQNDGDRDFNGNRVDKELSREIPSDILPKLKVIALPNPTVQYFMPQHPSICSVHYIDGENLEVITKRLELLRSKVSSPSQIRFLKVHIIITNPHPEDGPCLLDRFLTFVFNNFPYLEEFTIALNDGRITAKCAENICAMLIEDDTRSKTLTSLIVYHIFLPGFFADGAQVSPDPVYGYFSQKDIKKECPQTKLQHASIQYMISERPPMSMELPPTYSTH
ncbi:hypothetical protein C8Q75DRAFT_808109 [Abortiporus biennis]|nr:hypothetical protein C8Q75DRAFT_808109 [Abortiporus biennis]